MPKIVIMGASLETGNRGVSALAASLVKVMNAIEPEAEMYFCVGAREPKEQPVRLAEREIETHLVNYRMSPKARLKEHLLWLFVMAFFCRALPLSGKLRTWIIQYHPILRTIEEADLVGDIRGGDSFSDIYGLKSLIMGSVPSVIALLLGKRLVLFPQTYGPYTSAMAKCVARYILSRSGIALSRDRQGAEVIQQICNGGREPPVVFCPDVAFQLDAVVPDRPSIAPPLVNQGEGPVFGLNVSGLLYNGGFTRNNMFGLRLEYKAFLRNLGERFLNEVPKGHLLLVPHTFGHLGDVESDNEACLDLARGLLGRFPSRVHIVSEAYDQSRIKGIIGMCDFFVGSRMHACIAALSQDIPTIGVAYSGKFVGVFESVGMDSFVVDARVFAGEEAIGVIMNGFWTRTSLTQSLSAKVESAKKQILSTFAELFSRRR